MVQLARLGFIVLGVYLVLGGLSGIPRELMQIRTQTSAFGGNFAGSMMIAFITYPIFSFLPGALLIAFSSRLARRAFPTSGLAEPFLSDSRTLVGAFLAVLAVYFVVSGSIGAIGSAIALIVLTRMDGAPVGIANQIVSMISDGVWIIGGVLIFRYGDRWSRVLVRAHAV